MSDYTNRHVLVIGCGRSGIAAARLLHARGAIVTVTDSRPAEAMTGPAQKLPTDVTTCFGGHSLDITPFHLAVISPGAPWEGELPTRLRQAGIELIAELELASRHITTPIIAITGSNGKSTTTCLVGHLLASAEKKVWMGGNLGEPLSEAVTGDYDWIVAEVSSFQLEGVTTFRPKIALLLNITPDHLDRHGDMKRYIALKQRITACQAPGDTLIVNGDDSLTTATLPAIGVRKLTFSRAAHNPGAYFHSTTAMATIDDFTSPLFDLSALTLPGPANEENALAAALAAFTAGVSPEEINTNIGSFTGLPHRMEKIAVVDGVTYINDSKGTNVDATIKALAGFHHDAALVAGGSSKGADFAPLATAIRKKTKGVALIGETAPAIAHALGDFQPVTFAHDMDTAVRSARSWVTAGETVILSPGCASFDMFRNFEQRGDSFRTTVKSLAEEARHAG